MEWDGTPRSSGWGRGPPIQPRCRPRFRVGLAEKSPPASFLGVPGPRSLLERSGAAGWGPWDRGGGSSCPG